MFEGQIWNADWVVDVMNGLYCGLWCDFLWSTLIDTAGVLCTNGGTFPAADQLVEGECELAFSLKMKYFVLLKRNMCK